MPVIRDLMNPSKRMNIQIDLDHIYSCDKEERLYACIGRPERDRWHREAIVPRALIEILKLWGIRGYKRIPNQGLPLMKFLDHLRLAVDKAKDPAVKHLADYIYKDTIDSEIMHNWREQVKPKKERVPAGVPFRAERPRTIAVQL